MPVCLPHIRCDIRSHSFLQLTRNGLPNSSTRTTYTQVSSLLVPSLAPTGVHSLPPETAPSTSMTTSKISSTLRIPRKHVTCPALLLLES